jgi:hypothetical protein
MAKLLNVSVLIGLLCSSVTLAAMGVFFNTPNSSKALFDADTPSNMIVEELKKLKSDQRQLMIERETQFYLSEPLSSSTLQNLAILRELDGQQSQSSEIALAAAEMSRRSVKLQLSAMQIDLASQRYPEAFTRLDGALRAQPTVIKVLLPALKQLAENAEARKHFAVTLSSRPPWRQTFFEQLSSVDTSGDLTYRLLSDIRKANGQIGDWEKQSLVWKFIYAKKFEQAYFVWLDLMDQVELSKTKNVFDGGFTLEPRDLGFGWNIIRRKTATIRTAGKPGQLTDRVLNLDFAADRDGGQYVFQYLQLQPNRYLAKFDAQIDSIKNEQGLVWRVRCVGSGLEIGTSLPINAKGPWEQKSFELEVPADNCAFQLLALENKSAAKLDQEITGRIAIDNFEMVLR